MTTSIRLDSERKKKVIVDPVRTVMLKLLEKSKFFKPIRN